MIHVRRRIYRAERAVEIRRLEVEGNIYASRKKCLEAISRPDVLLDPFDVRHEVSALVARAPFDVRSSHILRHGLETPWRPQSRPDVAQLSARTFVQLGEL